MSKGKSRTVSISAEEIEAELTLRDRINYTYLLAEQIVTFQKAILNMDLSEDEINEAIDGLVNMIPKSWRDSKFRRDIRKATSKTKIDVRPTFCGLKASVKYCIDNGIAVFVEQEERDYKKLFQACINLFDRRKLLTKRVYTEIMTGRRFKGKGKDLSENIEEIATT